MRDGVYPERGKLMPLIQILQDSSKAFISFFVLPASKVKHIYDGMGLLVCK